MSVRNRSIVAAFMERRTVAKTAALPGGCRAACSPNHAEGQELSGEWRPAGQTSAEASASLRGPAFFCFASGASIKGRSGCMVKQSTAPRTSRPTDIMNG